MGSAARGAHDEGMVAFLAWALPRLGLDPRGFRNVRGTLKRRLHRRMRATGATDLAAYRARLEAHPEEWAALGELCRITISRFWRDATVMEVVADTILPDAARAAERAGRALVRAWSAGCASGEEPYSIAIAWHHRVAPSHPGVGLEIVATDADDVVLARAERGVYEEGSLRELPAALRGQALAPAPGGLLAVREELRRGVRFVRQDLRREMPDGPFDLILCRNLAFTYLDAEARREVAERIVARLREGGALVVGEGERAPDVEGLEARAPCVWVRRA